MGKDIDRNITRQLWEKNKNSFTRNDIHNVTFDKNSSKFSIINDTLILEGFFDSNNTYNFNFDGIFVPFI